MSLVVLLTCSACLSLSNQRELESSVRVKRDWVSGYCAEVILNNPGPGDAKDWQVQVDVGSALVRGVNEGNISRKTGLVTIYSKKDKNLIRQGENVYLEYCANKRQGRYLPKIMFSFAKPAGTTSQIGTGTTTITAVLAEASAIQSELKNPFEGTKFYIDTEYHARVVDSALDICQRNASNCSSVTSSLRKLKQYPTAYWIDSTSKINSDEKTGSMGLEGTSSASD